MKRLVTKICVLILCISIIAGCAAPSATNSSSASPPSTDLASTASTEPEGSSSTEAGGPIRLGLISSLTGEQSLVGEYASNAMELFLEEINGSGGLLGREVEVVVEDDMGSDPGAVNAYNKLAQDDSIVGIVAPYFSTRGLAIAGEVAKAQIPTMQGGSAVAIGELDNDWMFQARSSDGIVAAAVAYYGVDTLHATKLSILYDSDAAGQGQMEAAVGALKDRGIEAVTCDAFNTGEKDFTAQIVRIQQAGAEVILAYALQIEAGLMMKQIRDMGMTIPIVGNTSFPSKIALDLAGEAAEGVYSCVDYVPTSPRPKTKVFAPKYKEKFGIESDFTASVVYDQLLLLAEAIKIAGSTDRTAIRDAVYKIQDFEGTSTVFSFDEKGRGGTGVLLTQVQNGVPVVLDMISAR